MRNNKGFTLIELLAVIIILAIIALITTPIILNVVQKARLDAAKDKAWGTIDAVKVAYAQDQADNETLVSFPLDVDFDGPKPVVGITEVKMSGQRPESGTVTMHEDGTFTCNKLKYGNYCCTTTDGNTMSCDPDNCE